MNILNEIKSLGFHINCASPQVTCRVFEDNSGALEMANNHRFCPRTKHINVKLHHFRDYVARGEIVIKQIHTTLQLADYLTKPVNEETLIRLRKRVLGW